MEDWGRALSRGIRCVVVVAVAVIVVVVCSSVDVFVHAVVTAAPAVVARFATNWASPLILVRIQYIHIFSGHSSHSRLLKSCLSLPQY